MPWPRNSSPVQLSNMPPPPPPPPQPNLQLGLYRNGGLILYGTSMSKLHTSQQLDHNAYFHLYCSGISQKCPHTNGNWAHRFRVRVKDLKYLAKSRGVILTPKSQTPDLWQNNSQLYFVRFSLFLKSKKICEKLHSWIQDNRYIEWSQEANFVLLWQYRVGIIILVNLVTDFWPPKVHIIVGICTF